MNEEQKHDAGDRISGDNTSKEVVSVAKDCCGENDCDSNKLSELSCSTASPERNTPRQPRQQRPWERTDKSKQSPPTTMPADDRVPRRWDRFVRLVGDAGAKRLLASHVTVFGLGGVGSFVAESLARSAVGRLSLVDFDDVCVTNVNRQIQAFPSTVGQSKADLLATRVRAINPDAWVDSIQAFYDPTTSDELLTPRPDFVVDAIDNVTAKIHLLQICLENKIPVVSVTGAGARWDPTQVRVADLSKTKVDPLARVIRKELSKRGVDTTKTVGIPVVYSEEDICEPETPSWDEVAGFQCICPHREDSPHACEKRRIIYGTASFVTSAFAAAASSVVVRQLSKAETT